MSSARFYHTLQAVNSVSFQISRDFLACQTPLPVLWDFHLDHSPDHPLFVFERSSGCIEKISWSAGVQAMHRASYSLKKAVPDAFDPGKNHRPVIGILAFKDIPTSWALITGVMRLGATAFLISPRNSAVAVANMLKGANCHVLIMSSHTGISNLVHDASDLLEREHELTLIEASLFDELYLADATSFERLPPCQGIEMEAPALILHSSGSTSFPRLVTSSHRTLVNWSLISYFGDKDLCGYVCGANSLPVYRRAAGQVSVIYSPYDTPSHPTADTVLSTSLACSANYIYTVPTNITEWAREKESVDLLRTFDLILFAGGPLNTHIGDGLAARGVRLCSMYGTTECGAASRMIFDGDVEDWEYIQATRQTSIYWKPQPGDDHLYEAESPYKLLAETNTIIFGRRGFATGDLFEKHPRKEGLWRLCGRADDQIMHSTGEKAKSILTRHPSISHALVFGRGQFHVGVLIEPSPSVIMDMANGQSSQNFIELIWSTIQEANDFAPKHSRIFKEMLVIASPAKPFTFTAKRTMRRNVILDDYADEIAAAYRSMKNADNSSIHVNPPSSWDFPRTLPFIRSVIASILNGGTSVGDDDDLFQHGLDSLQAMVITNEILRAFRNTATNTTRLQDNFVHAHPTISALARFVTSCSGLGPVDTSSDLMEKKAEELQETVAKLTASFSAHSPRIGAQKPTGETVLVTGTTGSLGTQLLAQLIRIPTVTRVYALNRGEPEETRRRQENAFERQAISSSVARSTKVVYLRGDITSSALGLGLEMRDEVLDSLTTIVHNAWMVNFNMPFAAYLPLIEGVREVVELALASPLAEPPRIVFVSSVSAVRGWSMSSPIPETVIADPRIAVGNGYGESKWAAERIMSDVRRTTVLKTVIARVGQLCGTTTNGCWNANEWFPLIVRSADALHSLPERDELVSWLPVDTAASAILDLRHVPDDMECVHIMHPRPVPWSSIITPLAKALDVPLLPYSEWLQSLQNTSSSISGSMTTPAVLLANYFASLEKKDRRGQTEGRAREHVGRNMHVFSVERGQKTSRTLGDPTLAPLGTQNAEKWLKFWKQGGFL
ncbi:tridomain enzyme adenylation-thiolation-dehydrogenase [Heterobasidion irregulare TC 32-1]|uniref:Tridomain enzyme adenylation-thiolation-dehydrogenase n=1 Tax=Heterobasidion irregulare (strain TC 32-1) TaxID=747525 RepID=W4K7W9_HETIT|nr:tridomain enzyme adenylation-thiolation-dehydrogenase [Heterobasidion irregulare TC 32-1]ETW81166.1 tridomain enzyme adenylation-thiolation-dehydrogenase [Heterobasidion irregulare TC 32-1]